LLLINFLTIVKHVTSIVWLQHVSENPTRMQNISKALDIIRKYWVWSPNRRNDHSLCVWVLGLRVWPIGWVDS